MITATRGWLGSTSLVGRRLDRFQDLASLRSDCVLARVIGGGIIRKFRFEINLRPRVFFDGLLRRILSERTSKGDGVQQGTHVVV